MLNTKVINLRLGGIMNATTDEVPVATPAGSTPEAVFKRFILVADTPWGIEIYAQHGNISEPFHITDRIDQALLFDERDNPEIKCKAWSTSTSFDFKARWL